MNEILRNIVQILIDNQAFFEFFITSALIIHFDGKSFNAMVDRNNYKNLQINVLPAPLLVKKDKSMVDFARFDNKYRKDIEEFYKVLMENVSEDVIISFYDNIKELQIKDNYSKASKYIKTSNCLGSYSTDNTIEISTAYRKSILFHELLHLSSSCVREDKLYIGFNQMLTNSDIGRGINEGYTEYLNQLYFKNQSNSKNYYTYLKNTAGLLEKIIGHEKMQSLYFKSNLLGLIEELSNYCGPDKARDFIKYTDYVYRFFHVKEHFLQNDLIQHAFVNINHILIEAYYNKLKEENLNAHDFNMKLQEYLVLIPETFYSGDKTYYIEYILDMNEFVDSLKDSEKGHSF